MNYKQNNTKQNTFKTIASQRGQILIEYILLLLIGITIATMLSKSLTGFSDEPDDRGIIIKRWIRSWDSSGKDLPDQ